MMPNEVETLLELHRQFCTAVRDADQAFARLYVADPNSDSARQHERRYAAALAQARAALGALEITSLEGTRRSVESFADAVEGARSVC